MGHTHVECSITRYVMCNYVRKVGVHIHVHVPSWHCCDDTIPVILNTTQRMRRGSHHNYRIKNGQSCMFCVDVHVG